jgi:hypothetical protein
MQLCQQQHLSLHEDINTYLKDFSIPATYRESVTLAHLLTHSAGFDWRMIGTLSRSKAERPTLGDHLAAWMPPRIRPAGTVISYSNYGMALAGYVVEEISGMPFAQYVHERILQPLEMYHSSFEVPSNVAGDVATGYRYRTEDVYDPLPPEYLNIPPAGQLVATATDMANFMIAHLQDGRFKNRHILGEAGAQQMHQRQFAHHPQLPGWCYGFNEGYKNGRRIIGHAGGISGIWSYLLLVPGDGVGLFVSQNGGDFLAPTLINAFMDKFFTVAAQKAKPPVRKSPSVPLRKLVGCYRYSVHPQTTIARLQVMLGIPEVEVRMDDDGLLTVENYHSGHIRVPSGPYAETGPLLFREVDGECHIAFRRNGQGRVTHLLTDAHWDAVSYDRLSWYDRPTLHLGLLACCSLVFLSACIGWPVGALLRRARKGRAVLPEKTGLIGRRARLWAGVTCGLILAMLLAVGCHLYSSPLALAYGELGAIPYLLVLPLATTASTVCLVLFLMFSWKKRYFGLLGRLHYALVVVAAAAVIPFLWYWNLLGFNY